MFFFPSTVRWYVGTLLVRWHFGKLVTLVCWLHWSRWLRWLRWCVGRRYVGTLGCWYIDTLVTLLEVAQRLFKDMQRIELPYPQTPHTQNSFQKKHISYPKKEFFCQKVSQKFDLPRRGFSKKGVFFLLPTAFKARALTARFSTAAHSAICGSPLLEIHSPAPNHITIP